MELSGTPRHLLQFRSMREYLEAAAKLNWERTLRLEILNVGYKSWIQMHDHIHIPWNTLPLLLRVKHATWYCHQHFKKANSQTPPRTQFAQHIQLLVHNYSAGSNLLGTTSEENKRSGKVPSAGIGQLRSSSGEWQNFF